MKPILNIIPAYMRQAKLLILGATFGMFNLSFALAEDMPVENGTLSHFELVLVKSGEELRSVSLGIGSGVDVQIESGYINKSGEFIEIFEGGELDSSSAIGSYSSVIVFGE